MSFSQKELNELASLFNRADYKVPTPEEIKVCLLLPRKNNYLGARRDEVWHFMRTRTHHPR